jgi:hypothetical protein
MLDLLSFFIKILVITRIYRKRLSDPPQTLLGQDGEVSSTGLQIPHASRDMAANIQDFFLTTCPSLFMTGHVQRLY